MTQRLYYDDVYQQEFQAQVLERVTVGNGLGLILDKPPPTGKTSGA